MRRNEMPVAQTTTLRGLYVYKLRLCRRVTRPDTHVVGRVQQPRSV